MKLMTYNVKNGGVTPPTRLDEVLTVIAEQDPTVLGLQECKVSQGEDNELVYALRNAGNYPYDVLFDRLNHSLPSGTALFSTMRPTFSRIVGEGVRAVEMLFPTQRGSLSICNVHLTHVSEAERLPEIQEVLQELRDTEYSVVMGDFNALSPQDGIPQAAVASFSPRMLEKYCRDGRLCYDTVEAVLNEGYVDVGLRFHRPEEITDRTDLSGPTRGGGHTRPIRMDFIFAKESVLPYIRELVLVHEGLARRASDHFPWYVTMDDSLFRA